MGFFAVQNKVDNSLPKGPSLEFLHRHGCQVCPLYHLPGNKNPDMKPTGSKHPLVYILGEWPGAEEDAKGVQFVGKSGRVLRMRIPEDWLDKIRWNNVVRTRPPGNREPTPTEIECCRRSIISDIEATKPEAIFGFGNVPLHWAIKESGITKWNGKRVPVKIGEHTCWFYPMLHPSGVMRSRKFMPRSAKEYGSDTEFVFALNLKHAFAEIEAGLPEPIVHSKDFALADIECITGHNSGDLRRVKDFLLYLYDEPYVGLDYETNCLRPYQENAKILTAALSSSDYTMAFAMDHKEAGWSEKEREELDQCFEDFLYEAKCKKIAHHLAFELEWSGVKYGKKVIRAGQWGDSLSQSYLLDARQAAQGREEVGRSHSLETLCLQHFGINIKDLSNVNRKKLDKEPLPQVLLYNGMDAKYHRLLFLVQIPELKKHNLQKVYEQHIRRVPTMVLTQIKGVPIDQKVVAKLEAKYTKRQAKVENELFALPCVKKFKGVVGHKFNPASNPDISKMLKKILGIDLEGGADEDALSEIKHPFAKLLIKWRKANKVISTYILSVKEGAPESNLWPDKLLHPIMNTTRVRTWRTSSDSPNAQNWPKRGPNKEVRKQVRPVDVNLRIVAFDYSGIQARNVAMESKDKKLVDAFWHHYDIHGDFTERLVRLYPQWIAEGAKALAKDKDLFKAYRNRTKNEFVFPSFFGSIPSSVARNLGVPEKIGIKLQEQFWHDFADVPKWHESLQKTYFKHGYITGLSGFKHFAPVAQTERVNYPIQADESVIVCGAMSRLSEYGQSRFQANMEIHDDLTFIWPKNEIDKNAEIVLKEMLTIEFPWINVPLEVEMSIGEDWFSLQDVGKFESMMKGGYKQA